ncbi:NAC domain-containing protein 82-like isoform X2 [Lycium barbarum]|uniref:NAC domain-containing protein 82-like isoform X2 n=1 Tax=Lycium barbarum TaxID=112863 RepID=UPI00293E3CA7|nr:NAC domain-containing protein 82-like isoform X2 [Lycium barbarum]
MAKLPPGFRFHPTDVELTMYYLKRKIMGKKIPFEAISELNIYKFSPWDLPDKCCYKSKDLEWYFFCPREKKYASGARMNRATETGYWKTTGKDRPVLYNEKIVGSVKTLVFHKGNAPRGQRMDWVIHEYRFEDKDMADTGIPLDTYVLCKVFKKSGPGPKNGAQYGAPFKEEDWEDDEAPAEHNPSSIPSLPLPNHQTCSIVTCMVDPGTPSGCTFTEMHPPFTQPSIHEMSTEPNSSNVTPVPAMPANLSCSVFTTMVDPGNKSLWPSTALVPSSAELFGQKMPQDVEDDIFHLFDNFTEDPAIFPVGNVNNLGPNDMNLEAASFIDENDIYNGLESLDNCVELDQTTFDLSVTQGTDCSHNPMFFQDVPYLELKDLEIPLSHSAETFETARVMMGDFCVPHSSDVEMRQFCYGSNSSERSQPVAEQNQLHDLPEHYVQQVIRSDLVNCNVANVNQGYNAPYPTDFSSRKQPVDSRYTAQNQERGEQQRKIFSCMYAHSASNSVCAGFSIHAKAEVILWIDGCTDDALLAVLGDSSTGLTYQSAVNKADKEGCDCCYDFTTFFFFGINLACILVSLLNFVGQFLLELNLVIQPFY